MIRLVLAEDQAMLRGALAALLALEDDIDVVAAAESTDVEAPSDAGEATTASPSEVR